jgi:regulator of sigma E protease
MDFLANFGAYGSSVIGYVIPFLFVLTIVVFFHELGHFLIARWNGVRVLVFSVGFGRELFGFTDRHGTRWKLSAIPLGGYVKFFGDESAASTPDQATLATMPVEERRHSFFYQSVRARAAIVVAGPVANFILAVVLFAGIFSLYGKPNAAARVDAVQPESAAAAAGFQAGDTVVAINGRTIGSFADMQRIVSENAGTPLEITVDRGGAKLDLKAVPALKEVKDSFGNVHRIGILGITRSLGPDDAKRETVDPFTGVVLGVQETWYIVDKTLSYLGGVVIGAQAADQLGGPARIMQVSGQVWGAGKSSGGAGGGLVALLQLAAVLSVSIGLLNLFPIPLLDGGHLMFYGVEAARGRPLSERAQEFGFRIGLAIVMLLMVFATFNDIRHLTGW